MTSRLGVRARFTLLYGAALIIMVMLVSGGIYFFVQRALLGQIENHLHKDFFTISEYLQHDQNGLIKVADHGPILLFSVQDGERLLVSSHNWSSARLGEVFNWPDKAGSLFSIQGEHERLYRILTGSAVFNNHTYRIAVAHDEVSVRQTLKTLALIILLLLPITVAVSLAIGYMIAGRVLAPISAFTRKAAEIGAENLSERLPVGDGDDEFSRLASVFNQTFARIEDSFARLKRFTADASHELRTPLAAIRSIGETALHTSAGQENCREAIGSILEESDRLRQLIDALLQLSRADAGGCGQPREAVDLAELARETVEFLNVLAEEKRQSIILTTSGTAIVEIDRASVRQALTNLLDNAIKYAPPSSEITISVGSTTGGELFVGIADQGSGIPEHERERIFDRFYRIDKGRSRENGGAGLGLSISRWAVESNGGRIEVESVINQGSMFRVIFPAKNL